MTIESNRRRRERYMRRHGWWPAWHWPSWDRWGWNRWAWDPRVTVIKKYEDPNRNRNLLLWLLAIVVVLLLSGMITVSYARR